MISSRLLKALEFAAIAHEGQKRKYPSNVPYVAHPFTVALILDRAGYEEDVVIAGALHDVIEDTQFTKGDIQEKFGEKVAMLVDGVTEQDKKLSWKIRKDKYLQHLADQSAEVAAVSAADLLANNLPMLEWEKFDDNEKKDFHSTPEERVAISQRRIEIIASKIQGPLLDELIKVQQELEKIS